MFTIDLLKGQGLPAKSRPESMAIGVATFAVPLIVAIVMFGCYLHSRIVVSIQKQGVINYQAKISELAEAVKLQKSAERERNIINNCLSEVSSSIKRQFQWSPVLVTLVKNMPGSVVLTKLMVKQHFVKRTVLNKNNLEETITISVPVRTLQMNVYGNPQYNCDRAVRDFRDRLCLSELLGPKLEDIRVSQEFNTLEGMDIVSYEIECIFKPGL